MIYDQFLSKFTNYKPITLYWQRFSIAEDFGREEIQATYDTIMKESKDDYKLLTELVMVLNHKSWQHCEDLDNSTLCDLYNSLYKKTYEDALDRLSGKELSYMLNTLD